MPIRAQHILTFPFALSYLPSFPTKYRKGICFASLRKRRKKTYLVQQKWRFFSLRRTEGKGKEEKQSLLERKKQRDFSFPSYSFGLEAEMTEFLSGSRNPKRYPSLPSIASLLLLLLLPKKKKKEKTRSFPSARKRGFLPRENGASYGGKEGK